eukprot:TRINITY_DN4382_c0_g1_i1.p1 TRINITY_DN4382_c0_g1~~TRINITY_DN4382_c0_g1_i1.p1  ORF type:complete len:210 (+),score=36.58 TRINITY_DN4382_c0_g1_i1:75-704(+)
MDTSYETYGEEPYGENFEDDLPNKRPSGAGPQLTTTIRIEEPIQNPLVKVREMTWYLQIHIIIAVVTCATAFVVWHYVSLNTFWWWVYPIFFFSISITGHIFFPEEKYLEGVVIISIIVNVMFFITESLTSRNFPHWFLWPAGISIMLGHTIYNTKYSSDKPSWPIYAAEAVVSTQSTGTGREKICSFYRGYHGSSYRVKSLGRRNGNS